MQITLANLKDATEQQVFDQVAKHMLTQNKASFKNHDCAYRGDNGLMCAAGCLIGDDEYKPEFDTRQEDGLGTSWDSLIRRELIPNDHQKLITRLQTIHDEVDRDEDPVTWPDRLSGLANSLNLNTDVVDEFTR